MSVPTFTGSETPSDVAHAAIEWFSQKPNSLGITIFYENSIPKLKYEFQGGDAEFVCIYRLDQMLESFYSDAEQIFAENLRVNFVSAEERAILLPYIAFSGMTTMLSHLVVLLAEVFLGTLEDTRMLTAGIVLHSLVAKSEHKTSLSRPASKTIQGWIEKRIDAIMQKKREYFAGYMNAHRLLHIPTGVGRPRGTTKPAEKSAEDSAKFAREIEGAVRELYSKAGKSPTKTDVARFLKPGVNPKTGTDSRLSVFTKKCKHLKIDFDVIVARVCGLSK